VEKELDFLATYIVTHFIDEEKLQMESDYPFPDIPRSTSIRSYSSTPRFSANCL
jgi:hemerythrin